MEKIDVKTLDDTTPGGTATEVLMNRSVITNHAAKVIGKINEIVDRINEIDSAFKSIFDSIDGG